jgi:hypothetical protein
MGGSSSVLIGVVAFTMMRVVSVVGLLPPIHPSTSTGIQDDTSITDGANTLMYRGQVGGPCAMWCLVDGRVPSVPPGGHTLVGVRSAPS